MDTLMLDYRKNNEGGRLFKKEDGSYLLIPHDSKGDELLAKGIPFGKFDTFFNYFKDEIGEGQWVTYKANDVHEDISDSIREALVKHPYFEQSIDFESQEDTIKDAFRNRNLVFKWLKVVPGADFSYDASDEEIAWCKKNNEKVPQ